MHYFTVASANLWGIVPANAPQAAGRGCQTILIETAIERARKLQEAAGAGDDSRSAPIAGFAYRRKVHGPMACVHCTRDADLFSGIPPGLRKEDCK